MTSGNIPQRSLIHCLSVCLYIYPCVSLIASCLHNTHKQYCCQAMCLRLCIGQQNSLLCLSVHLCLSIPSLCQSLCLHLFQHCSWLLSHYLTLGNITRGSPVLFVCLPVGCYDNTFPWLPSSPTLSEVYSSSQSIINDKNTAPQISQDYLIPCSCLQWPSTEAFSSSKGRGNIIFLLFSFVPSSPKCTFSTSMWYRFLLKERDEDVGIWLWK